MHKYLKWIDKNCNKLNDEIVVITGGYGTIGFNITYYLVYLGAKIVMLARDFKKANICKERILKDFPNAKIDILYVDLFDIESIDKILPTLIKYKIKYFISNAGIYHLPKLKNKYGLERTLTVNFYAVYKLINGLKETIARNNGKIILQSSISINFVNFKKIDFDDLNFDNTKNLTLKYAKTKALLTIYGLYLKRKGVNIEIVQPGVVATGLFSASRGGFSKLFINTIVPLMKVLFISPSKGALPCLFALNKNSKYGYWFGPRGFLKIYGYPNVQKINKKNLNAEFQDILVKKLEVIDEKIKSH